MQLFSKNILYYILLFIIGFFIYKFQIEKSFNLLTIYSLCVSFSFTAFIFKLDSKKIIPIIFLVALFAMYGVNNETGNYQWQLLPFFFLLSIFTILLIVLLSKYKLIFKKIAFIVTLLAVGSIYLIKDESLSHLKYIPFVIGSFFIFRSISYLHETKFLKKQVPLIDNLNYFLLPSNFSMPLFPIVDYKSFISSYQGINRTTLERSSLLIFRGLFQMLLYRFIYHQIIIPFDEIQSASQLLIFLVANFMIVLRVIGAFHIAIGLVILLGYNIPDIFNNLFFSTGFSDLWRRINMYWNNFIIKVFYYPIYFKIKKMGVYPALLISTFSCFIITWFLHSYQWFWLKGSFPIQIQDAIFWGTFGILVSINTYMQQKKLERPVAKKEKSFNHVRLAFSGLIVLIVMSVLWSIWTSNSLSYWWSLVSNIKNIDLNQLKIIALLSGLYILIASLYHFYQKKKERRWNFIKINANAISYAGFILLFLTLHFTSVFTLKNYSLFYRTKVAPIVSEQLNKADLTIIDNGYYTNLISTNNYCSQVWINDYDISRNWTKYITSKTTKPSFDLMITENIPYASVKYKGINYTLNQDGLRDKTYPKLKPDSCYRIVILGGSYECGNGMNDGADFISLVEEQLKQNYIAKIDGKRINVELINFSSNGYRLIQRMYQYKDNARNWNPDAVLLFIHNKYHIRIGNYINRLVYQGFEINDTYLRNIIEMKKIEKNDNGKRLREKLGSYADSINYYAVSNISRIAHEDSTKLIAVYLPAIRERSTKRDSLFLENICSMYDMKKISLLDVFSGMDISTLTLSDADFHPNVKANGLIAEKLLDNILTHQDYFGIQFTNK